MILTIHTPTSEALQDIAERLCAEDVAELDAMGYTDALEVMKTSVAGSREAYVAHWYGRPQAVFGVADYEHNTNCGVPWLLSTGPRGRIGREFVKTSRRFIAEWSPMYCYLFNLVDTRHVRAQRWLMSLGFSPQRVHHVNAHPFIEFGMTPSCVP
ncbi:hypothetical protein [Dyella silvatica]|uniref:hypothetical protein n=1 Tax=Dyella silvatica TaxID=2992128 RepID=UPI0022535A74|nr:hypothetical protein [Dyella silvatica]